MPDINSMNNSAASQYLPSVQDAGPGQIQAQAAFVTPEAILSFCIAKISKLDGQVQSAMDGIDDNNKNAAEWVQFQKTLHGWKDVTGGDPGGLAGVHADMANDLLKQWNATNDPALKAAIGDFFQQVTGYQPNTDIKNVTSHVGPSDDPANPGILTDRKGLTEDDYKNLLSDTQASASADGQGLELKMASLQALMGQRQQILTMTTQIMQSIQDSVMKTIGHVGQGG